MSASAKKGINMKLVPPSSFEDTNSSLKTKEQLLTLSSDISNCTAEKDRKPLSFPNVLQLNTVSKVKNQDLRVETKQRKRARAKAGSKSQKRRKMSLQSTSNEETVDNDLFAFVESLNTDKNLGSDSSTDTIIMDNISDKSLNDYVQETSVPNSWNKSSYSSDGRTKPIAEQSLLKNINFQPHNGKHYLANPHHSPNSFSTFVCGKRETNQKLRTGEIFTKLGLLAVNGSEDGSLLSVTEIPNPQNTIIDSMVSVSSLRQFHNPSPLNKPPTLPPTSCAQPILRGLMVAKNSIRNPIYKNPIYKSMKKHTNQFVVQVSGAKETPPENSVNNCLMVSKLCQKDPLVNSQSVYASMGLDEDLCDSDHRNSSKALHSNSDSKESCTSLHPSKYNSPLNVPVKVEKDESSVNVCSNIEENRLTSSSKNDILSLNDLHVSMTFEAEPSDDDDDIEEDIPLSLLKDHIIGDEIAPEVKLKSEELCTRSGNVDDIPSSLFIKKELIEDYIVSESQAVSSNNILISSSANDNSSSKVQSPFLTSQSGLMTVKIKTEPDTEFPSSESDAQNISSMSVISNVLQASEVIGLSQKRLHESETSILAMNKSGDPSITKPNSTFILNTTSPASEHSSRLNGDEVLSFASGLRPGYDNPTDLFASKSSTKVNTNLDTENSSVMNFVPHLPEVQNDPRSCDGNSDMSSNQFDTDTESNSSRKKVKKKKNPNQSVNIDENVPITLLIKRQKSDPVDGNATDSFLCTSVSKFSKSESKSITSTDCQWNSTLLSTEKAVSVGKNINEMQNSVPEVDASLHLQTLVIQNKNPKKQRKQSKKKGTTKQSKPRSKVLNKLNDNACNSNSQLNSTVAESSKLPCHFQSTEDLSHQTRNIYSESHLKTASSEEQKCNTFVYMTFEEHSPVEEITEEDMNSILPVKKEKDLTPPRDTVGQSSDISRNILSVIKNIKQEKDSSYSESNVPEDLSSISSCSKSELNVSMQVEGTMPSNSAQTSNLNIEEDSSKSELCNIDKVSSESNTNVVSKKKKRRPRSYGWYKKKKSKSKDKTVSSSKSKDKTVSSSKSKDKTVSSVTVKNKDSELNSLLTTTAMKLPLVIVKNLLPVIKPTCSEENDGSLCSNQKQVKLPTKRKKRGLTSRKRKKSAKLADSSTTNEPPIENSTSNFNKDSNNLKDLEDNFGSHLLNATAKSELKKPCSENTITSFENVSKVDQVNVNKVNEGDKPVNSCNINSKKSESNSIKFGSLNIDEMAQEIATCEAILQKFENSSAPSDKSIPITSQGSTDKCNLKASDYGPGKDPSDQTALSNPNILEAFNSSFKSAESRNLNNFESNASVQVKKESVNHLKDLVECSNQISSHSNYVSKNEELNKTELSKPKVVSDSVFSNIACLKKEKGAHYGLYDKSVCNLTSSESNGGSVFISNSSTINPQTDKILHVHSVIETSSSSELLSKKSENVPQNSQPVDIDKIALSIKKEISSNTKSDAVNYVIKNQSELIQKASVSETVILKTSSNLSDSYNKKSSSKCSEQIDSYTSQIKKDFTCDDDEEIQILHVANQKSQKNVPCVDLTDDNCLSDPLLETQRKKSQIKSTEQVSTTQLSTLQVNTMQVSKNVSEEFVQSDNAIKMDNLSSKDSATSALAIDSVLIEGASPGDKTKQSAVCIEEEPLLTLESDNQLIESKADVLTPDCVKEKIDMKGILLQMDVSNSLISKDKYFDEYFKHPFPASIVLYNNKQRNRNKMYMRINSKALNLSIDKVESRLKLSQTSMPQFGKKLGDVVKLEKYPVSISEVECYHRILGVAPSQKLLSKCFISPDKKCTVFNSKCKMFTKPDNKIETDHQFNPMTCTLDDIIQGINETKMMYSNPNNKNNSVFYERECPSTDTKDSCDSHISNLSASQNKDLSNSNQKELGSSLDANSDGRNSALSCRLSDFNDIPNVDNSAEKSDEQNSIVINSNEIVNCPPSESILNYLTLPSQKEIDNIINNTESSSTSDNLLGLGKNALVNNELLSSNSCALISSAVLSESNANVECKVDIQSKFQDENRCNVNEIDSRVTNLHNILETAELRKILETAGSLCSDAVNNDNEHLWKSQATFEYNHTQSVPVVEVTSDDISKSTKDFTIEVSPYKSSDSKSTHVDGINTKVQDTSTVASVVNNLPQKATEENSDDDYVDNEPINNDSDYYRDDSSSHAEEQVNEEPIIPQYKSKWEKIMERKSQENKQKERINEHLLKDCFPVSSSIKIQSKKNNTFNKNVSKSSELQNSKTKEFSTEKQINKSEKSSEGKNLDQSDKFLKGSKKKAEKEKKKSVSVKSDTKKELQSRKNKAKAEDVSNLFVPDKLLKISNAKKSDINNKSNENNAAKCFYGNRITNRGTFLTETSSSKLLKKIKIPKKKTPEIQKRHSMRSEEFHSMVKSPDIDIESSLRSTYKNVNKSHDFRKNSEVYRSPLENTSSSESSHFISTKRMRNKQMRDRRMHFMNSRSHFPDEERIQKAERSSPIPHLSDNRGRKAHLSSSASSSSCVINDSALNRKISLLDTSASISSHYSNDASMMGKVPTLNVKPSFAPQLPSKSFQPNRNSEMSLLHSIISSLNKSTSSVPEREDNILPFSECMNPSWDKSEFSSPAYGYNDSPVRHSIIAQPTTPRESSVTTSYGIIPPSKSLDLVNSSEKHSIPDIPVRDQFDSSNILNSPFTVPVNSNSQIVPQPTRKASCLVPQHLKTLVGHEIIETHNVRLLMLEWSVDWLMQQQQFHDPPPISNALKRAVSSYENFEDYYNTYFPLMLLETWHRIYVSWTHLNQASPYSCQITSYSVKSHYVSIECQTVFNTAAHPKGVFPDEGSILMVKYSTKSNEYTIKILGYVMQVKTRRFNSVTDSKLFSSLRLHQDANPDVLQILSLTFVGAYNSEDIDKRQPVRIHVLCNVKPTLKQNDALLYINKSPLQRSILNPVADGLLSFTLTPRNSSLDKINECVRDITKGILSPHPLPLLTIVRAKPESDRLNIIPLLIEKMKSTYKTKVLLCVRTVRALGDIAANICLHQSLKLVIINKRCDTNPQFQKFLLDELVTFEMNKSSEDKSGEKFHTKNDTAIKIKKQILKDCDVVLSLIRNCHDEFIGETFTETESVAQMCCIVDEANLCTEPETLIPILHGISKLILIGDPDYPAKVLSKTASAYDYSQSFFQRAYDLDLITE